jgi:hypothetical protein
MSFAVHQTTHPVASLRGRIKQNLLRHLIGATVVKIVVVELIYKFFF